MITEDYVSFETAKLLREKGFDTACNYVYREPDEGQGYVLEKFFKPIKNSELIDEVYAASTLQTAMKWLREVHKIIITIDYDDDPDCEDNERYGFSVYCPSRKVDLATYVTYEEACEAALRDCLKHLIK